jgi:hypothetical protein
MFLRTEGQKEGVFMDDGIMVEHFGVDEGSFGDESYEVPEVGIGDVDHRGNGEDRPVFVQGVIIASIFLL